MLVLTEFQETLYDSLRKSSGPFEQSLDKLFSDHEDHPTIFADVLYLLGNIQATNSQAQVYFRRVDQHRRHLESLLGYSVDVRVALMDYFINVQPKYHQPKIVELSDFEESISRAAGDALTGLYNRSYFNEIAQSELSRSQRYGFNLAMVFIDIDHFKQINDGYGHQVGDQVLACMGQFLKSKLRTEDCAFRYGGEEFVLLLPQTAHAGLERTVRRLVVDVHTVSPRPDVQVTFSAGTAVFPFDGNELLDLIGCADRRMYKAKIAGRNRVVFEG
jgi:two-component system cell cycle response regulator